MYLDWETYTQLSSDLIAEEDFASSEAWAEAILDLWTLNRLHEIAWSKWEGRVALVMARLIDSKEAILSSDTTQGVESFSNSVDTYKFAEASTNKQLKAAYDYACDILPVELISRVVSYNGAN